MTAPRLISLADLARRLGMPRRRLHTQLRALDAELHGTVLVQSRSGIGSDSGKRGRIIYVNEAVLAHLMDVRTRSLEERVAELEAARQAHEAVLDEHSAALLDLSA